MVAGFKPWLERALAAAVFLAANLWVIWSGLNGIGTPHGDVTGAYLGWVHQLQSGLPWYGLGQSWVYPFPDLLFIYLPSLLGSDYQTNWLLMAVLFNVLALLELIGVRGPINREQIAAAWLWSLLIVLLGPVGISRLDNISIAFAVIAIALWTRARPGLASAFATFAVWIKVWPVALLLGFLSDLKRLRSTLIWAASAGIGVLVVGLLIGNPAAIFSFITQQNQRGIQAESPIASFWLWNNQRETNVIYFDTDLITFQIRAAGTDIVAMLMGPAQLVAISITAVLALLAARRLVMAEQSKRLELVAVVTLTASLDLIVFNKVGSPQYYGWLFVSAIMFVLWKVNRSLLPLATIGALAFLTQLIYPILYDAIVFEASWATWVLIARNTLAIALLVYANGRLIQLSKSSLSSGPTLSRSIKKPS